MSPALVWHQRDNDRLLRTLAGLRDLAIGARRRT